MVSAGRSSPACGFALVSSWRDGFQDVCAITGELSGCGVGVIGAGILSASAHGSGSESHIVGGRC